jgi:hypothetical protein
MVFPLFTLALLILGLFLLSISSSKTIILNPLAVKNTKQIESLSKNLTSKNISFSNVEQNNDLSYKILLKDNGTVYFSQKKDLSMQIDSLQLIVNRLTIEGKRFKTLDFRYDKPVISY